ncbi:hypothetical protein SSX86_024048 [Deinandra increscens subsp. villosa]|uniref:peroxidase n=1 Tax=Deinandra increscens subsp. villosa TaxID=3103831 RepID=A0AAP0GPB5_9ASTR
MGNLDFNPIFTPKSITQSFPGQVSRIGSLTDKALQVNDFVNRLESETRKIEAFGPEIPLCMLLVNHAIVELKEESMVLMNSSNAQQELEEFMPLKNTFDDGDANVEIIKDQKDKENGDKKNWLSSTHLWNTNEDLNQKANLEATQMIKKVKQEENKEKEETEKENAGRAIRKQRRRWSAELHRLFVDALQHLGGSQVATPKQIRELMKVDGLTNDEVKSHLQLTCKPTTPLRNILSRVIFFICGFMGLTFFLSFHLANSQLNEYYYYASCPNLAMIVKYGVWAAMKDDTRMAASLLRLHFHDCFVNGCDGSVLLDDTKKFKGEKNAGPNRNSIRGFEVIDNIKADVERACPSIVSCVDILTLAAREAVVLSGGPNWPVTLGRRDGLTANIKAANTNLPSPFESLAAITAKFAAVGLDSRDVVVLSGAHTIGLAQCFTFKHRLFDFKGTGQPDPKLDTLLATNLKTTCPNVAKSNTNLSSLDMVSTYMFDNAYYKNLVNNAGLLESDQALMSDPQTASMVNDYSMYPYLFYRDFSTSMMKLSNIGVITGLNGEVRKKCGEING